jgi:hypothetical protein
MMAEHHSPIHFEEVPLDEARRMGRGPRMEPQLYDTLRQKIQSLGTQAVRIRLGPEISPIRMKNYLLRLARDLNIPVTVRRVSDGVIFWRSSEEDVQHSREIAERLQSTQQQPRRQPSRRRSARARAG